jgi:hypothetical protein
VIASTRARPDPHGIKECALASSEQARGVPPPRCKHGRAMARRLSSRRADQALTRSRLSPSRELGPLAARVYIKGGLIEPVSRTTSAIGPGPIVPVPDGASADSASVLGPEKASVNLRAPTRRKRLRPRRARLAASGATFNPCGCEPIIPPHISALLAVPVGNVMQLASEAESRNVSVL